MEPLTVDDPRTLGRYRVLGRIPGRSSIARPALVLLGLDPTGRQVELTVGPPLPPSHPARDRFARDVRAAATAPPWFAAPVLDADPSAQRPWVATARVEGPTLGEYVTTSGPLPGAGLLALAVRTADGLVGLHAVGLTHGALDPTVLVLAQDGPRLVGLVPPVGPHSVGPDGISRAAARGTDPSTAPYRAPELTADGPDPGPPADVYALGAVLAWAATARSPGPDRADLGALAARRPELAAVIADCLIPDLGARPSAPTVQARLRALDTAATTPAPATAASTTDSPPAAFGAAVPPPRTAPPPTEVDPSPVPGSPTPAAASAPGAAPTSTAVASTAVNEAGVNGAGVNGTGINGAGVNGAGVTEAAVNGTAVNGSPVGAARTGGSTGAPGAGAYAGAPAGTVVERPDDAGEPTIGMPVVALPAPRPGPAATAPMPVVPPAPPPRTAPAHPGPVPRGPGPVPPMRYGTRPAAAARPGRGGVIAIVAVAALLVGGIVFGSVALFGDAAGPAPVPVPVGSDPSPAPQADSPGSAAAAPDVDDPAADADLVDPSAFGTDTLTFATPSGNIACEMSDVGARCDVAARTWTVPPAPADCAQAWGTGAVVSGSGPATLSCVGDSVSGAGPAVLAYGQALERDGMVCVSREDGVRCQDRDTGHGFRVARAGYDLY